METRVQTPLKLFNLPQYLQIPLFQRPYVWNEEHQWEPLWLDVRRLAELRAERAPDATHFLGAVVLQEQASTMGDAEVYSLIDGQQRVTTVQLLMNAASTAFRVAGAQKPATVLAKLTLNDADLGFEGSQQLKVQHSNDDGDPFREVMLAEDPVDYSGIDDGHLITRAHRYFFDQISEWLSDADSELVGSRAEALANTLRLGLEFVVITLTREENSQAIFETLNARGTPLTQADLIKNFVFQKLEDERVDTRKTYDTQWKLFEQKFWTTDVSLGRYSIPRVSLFLNHWLVSKTGEEISTRATFPRFKHWVEYEADLSMLDIVESLHSQASTYQRWAREADRRDGDLGVVPLFLYRTQAAGIEAIKPAVFWLYDPANEVPSAISDAALRWLESWVMRRALLRRSMTDVSRTVAQLIVELKAATPEQADVRTREFLSALSRPSTYWPSDRELRTELGELPMYSAHSKSRLRMFLEAIEDDLRGYTTDRPSRTGARVSRDKMYIEHLLPQRWQDHWPVPDLQAEVARDNHVHLLGNLTLLTSSLNSSVSNRAWPGEDGKRAVLERHDVLLMNRKLRGFESWDEKSIAERTEEATSALIRTWPAPEGHDVVPTARTSGSDTRYVPFRELVAAGIIPPGTELFGRGDLSVRATVTPEGNIDVNGRIWDSPSGAAKAILGHSSNGWSYWRTRDGRRINSYKPQLFRMQEAPEREENL